MKIPQNSRVAILLLQQYLENKINLELLKLLQAWLYGNLDKIKLENTSFFCLQLNTHNWWVLLKEFEIIAKRSQYNYV